MRIITDMADAAVIEKNLKHLSVPLRLQHWNAATIQV